MFLITKLIIILCLKEILQTHRFEILIANRHHSKKSIDSNHGALHHSIDRQWSHNCLQWLLYPIHVASRFCSPFQYSRIYHSMFLFHEALSWLLLSRTININNFDIFHQNFLWWSAPILWISKKRNNLTKDPYRINFAFN